MSELPAAAAQSFMAPAAANADAEPTPLSRRLLKFAIWAIVIVLVLGVLEFVGFDFTGWIESVWDNIRKVSPLYIVAALTFKTAESCLTAMAWWNMLRATYPDKHVSYKLALGAYQGGVGINAIAPAKAGTWTMLGLFRLYIPGSKLATLVVTPGGLGTTQAVDAVVLRNYTSTSNATAYSLSQDAIITAWNVVFGLIVMCWAFGWSETKQLVRDRKQVSEHMEEEEQSETATAGEGPSGAPATGSATPPAGR